MDLCFEVGTVAGGHCVWLEAPKTAVAARLLDGGQGIRAAAREVGANGNMVRKRVRREEACCQPSAPAAPAFAGLIAGETALRPAPADIETLTPIRLHLRDLVVELSAILSEPATARVFPAIGALR